MLVRLPKRLQPVDTQYRRGDRHRQARMRSRSVVIRALHRDLHHLDLQALLDLRHGAARKNREPARIEPGDRESFCSKPAAHRFVVFFQRQIILLQFFPRNRFAASNSFKEFREIAHPQRQLELECFREVLGSELPNSSFCLRGQRSDAIREKMAAFPRGARGFRKGAQQKEGEENAHGERPIHGDSGESG